MRTDVKRQAIPDSRSNNRESPVLHDGRMGMRDDKVASGGRAWQPRHAEVSKELTEVNRRSPREAMPNSGSHPKKDMLVQRKQLVMQHFN